MALLQRLSDKLWSYVSPAKENNAPKRELQAAPKFKSPAVTTRSTSLHSVVSASRSMSPVARVDSWRVQSSSRDGSSVMESNKRKRSVTTSKHRKTRKTVDDKMGHSREVDEDSDVSMEDQDDNEDVDDFSEEMSDVHSHGPIVSSSPESHSLEELDDTGIDSSLVVSEPEYEPAGPRRKILVSPTTEHFSRGVSTEELRAQGWDDDHIVLVQKIAMRGHEPLMPNYWKFQYRFHMPDGLFISKDGDDADAIISSVRADHFRALLALEKLLELGGWVRDRVFLKGRITPEQQVRRTMNAYIKWAEEDSGLDRRTAIPLLTMETQPADTDADELKASARRKCAALAKRYRNAFRVLQSIEDSPGSRTSTQISYPTPTIYALIASHTVIALTAYNSEDAEPDIKIVAMFDMKDRDYDVWNAFALAIVVCHVRNVQMRIADETGLGMKTGGREEKKVEFDWDA